MNVRLHNSCTYKLYEDNFEIKSELFGNTFRFRGFSKECSKLILSNLQNGLLENNAIDLLSDITKSTKNKIEELISFLLLKKYLIKCKDINIQPPKDTLYDRQIRFLDSYEGDGFDGNQINKILQNKKVVIVGLGAYGSWLALHSARLGIKHIVGIDYDYIELSNLPRQVLYSFDDIGALKSAASAKLINAVDPTIRFDGINKKISSENDLIPYIKDADLVFNAFGYYSEKEASNYITGFITKACINEKIPMLCLSTSWVGPLYIPEMNNACYFCTVNNSKLTKIIEQSHKNPRVDKRAFGPVLAISCSLAITEMFQYFTQVMQPKTSKGLYVLDPFQIDKTQFVEISALQNCAYCSSARSLSYD